MDIFHSNLEARVKLEGTMDAIRHRFGKTAIVRAASLKHGATYIARSQLVGGHSGGQSLE